MFRIGEFSKLTQVSVRMLRYYDKMGLLRPEQIDRYTGYRWYSIEQIPILNKIIFLRDMGFQVSEIANSLNHWNNDFIKNKIKAKKEEIGKEILAQQQKLSKIELAMIDIEKETLSIHYNVTLKSIPTFQVLSYRKTIPDYYSEGAMWALMSEFAAQNHVTLTGESFSIYHDKDYRENNVDVELCAIVNKSGENKDGFVYRETEPIPITASTMVYGEFKNISGAYLSFAGWLGNNIMYRMNGVNRQIVHRGPWNEKNPEHYLVEIQIPLEIIEID